MPRRRSIHSQEQLSQLSAEVHDWWIDLDSFEYEEGAETCRVFLLEPVRANRRDAREHGALARIITISHVELVEVEDRAGIQHYPVTRLEYDEGERVLTVKSDVPMRFEVRVERLMIEIEDEAGRE